jgi:hypothetical protein|mmetsp:Transcript_39674/g.63025  ORF Transcript_39674/g.63025 Transcript_39674/m.63025 type:complete len:306 (-) Transcript_39674:24-941(-)
MAALRYSFLVAVSFHYKAAALALDGISEDLRRKRRAEPLIGNLKYVVSVKQGNARLGLGGVSDCGAEGQRVFAFPSSENRGSNSMSWKLRYVSSLPQEHIQILIPSYGDQETMQLGVCGESTCDGSSYGVQAFPEGAGVYQWAMEKNSSYASGTVVRFRSPNHEDCYLGACGVETCEGAQGFGLHCYKGDSYGRTKRDVHWTLVSAESSTSWDDFLASPVELPIGAETGISDELQRQEAARQAALNASTPGTNAEDPGNDFSMDVPYDSLNGSQELLQGVHQGNRYHEGAQSFLVSGRGSISRND